MSAFDLSIIIDDYKFTLISKTPPILYKSKSYNLFPCTAIKKPALTFCKKSHYHLNSFC